MRTTGGRAPLGHALTVLLAVALTALALEAGVRAATSLRPVYDVEMWKYGTRLKRRAADPALAHEHVPGARARLYGAEIVVNSRGLRDREFEAAPAPGVHRVLFLGDSLTLGWGVELDRTFAKRLEPLLGAGLGRPVEVLNAGVGNYNTAQERAYFEAEGRRYRPAHVMLLYFINDAEPTPAYRPSTLKERSMLAVFLWSRVTRLMTRLGMRPDYRTYYRALYSDSNPGWRESRRALRALNERAKSDGFAFTVFVCPELRRLKPDYAFAEQHRALLSFLREEGVDHADLLPLFQARPEPESAFWVSPEDSHPNELGHRVIAEGIAAHVLARAAGARR